MPFELFAEFPILPECKISIAVPVRDEAGNVEKTLEAFAGQVDLNGQRLDPKKFEILVLANNCTDDSIKIIENFQRKNPSLNIYSAEISLPEENANIGFARRLVMEAAHKRLCRNGFGGVIMTTDGDTTAAADWIAANLREIAAGADAVGGRIIISASELAKMDDLCREIHLKDEEYRLLTAEIEALIDDLPFDHAPRHHQHFNGSFAVTTEIYEKAGGIPDVKFLEDCAFFDRLQRIDARVRHSPNVRVYTSARSSGRSEVGLSFQINQWKNLCEAGENFHVEAAQAIVERFAERRDLRKIWREFTDDKIVDAQKIEYLSTRIFVDAAFIFSELAEKRTFGAFYENVTRRQNNGERARKFPPVPLDDALGELKAEIKKYPAQSFSQTSRR